MVTHPIILSLASHPRNQHVINKINNIEGHSLSVSSDGLLPPEYAEEAVSSALSRLAVPDVHSHHVGRGEGASDVPLWFGNDNVHLGGEHAPQRHCHTQADREGRGDDLVVGAEVDGHEGQPDDAGSVHCKGDVFSLVEVGWHVPRLEGIVGAAHDKQAVVAQRRHHAYCAGITDEEDLTYAWVRLDGQWRLHNDQCDLQR